VAFASQSSRLAGDPMRPQFHFLPAANWMNDPNAPIYWNGRYHMFYQYNPHDSVWGDMHWGHAISPDMIHWTHYPIALAPTPGGPDAAGCFTGSAIVDKGRVAVLYTGIIEAPPVGAAVTDAANRRRESQCLAFADDPKLIHWTKVPQPVIPEPPAGMAVTGFRDPSAWKQGDWYYMTVGSGIPNVGGTVLLYRSQDLRQWSYMHFLARGKWNGNGGKNVVASGEMWECPEFFPLGEKHVLIYSSEGKVFWQAGTLDQETMQFESEHDGLLDLGSFYAPKTQLDAKGRRILWGWIRESRPNAQLHAAGWAGMMSLPRVLSLASDGSLQMETLPELKALRAGRSTSLISAACGEFVCSATAAENFLLTLTAEPDATELMHISYSAAKQALIFDDKIFPLDIGQPINLHGFVDGSVVELTINGRGGYAKRFYYSTPKAPDIAFHIVAGESQAWGVRPISHDRLTS